MSKTLMRGEGKKLQQIIQSLIDDFVEEFPETPIQTIHIALTRLAKDYDPAEEEGSEVNKE